ncbi:putative Ubiquitin-like domain-containing protein [Dioscorea sansibarensis]
MAMYIRVKREKTTYFLQCDPTEKTSDIKQKLQVLTDQPTDKQRLTLVSSNEILVDSKTLAEQKVENDAVVALTFRKDDDEFEEVNIARPEDFTSFS